MLTFVILFVFVLILLGYLYTENFWLVFENQDIIPRYINPNCSLLTRKDLILRYGDEETIRAKLEKRHFIRDYNIDNTTAPIIFSYLGDC